MWLLAKLSNTQIQTLSAALTAANLTIPVVLYSRTAAVKTICLAFWLSLANSAVISPLCLLIG